MSPISQLFRMTREVTTGNRRALFLRQGVGRALTSYLLKTGRHTVSKWTDQEAITPQWDLSIETTLTTAQETNSISMAVWWDLLTWEAQSRKKHSRAKEAALWPISFLPSILHPATVKHPLAILKLEEAQSLMTESNWRSNLRWPKQSRKWPSMQMRFHLSLKTNSKNAQTLEDTLECWKRGLSKLRDLYKLKSCSLKRQKQKQS